MSTTALCNVWQLAARQADLTARLPGNIPLFFRRIPPGSFLMGERGGGEWDTEPVHRVVIAREFFLGTFVVTQEQYGAVAGACPGLAARMEPSHFKGPHRPVECVDWHEATAFCEWLSSSGLLPADLVACLPTEAQWEYACRAGSSTDYYSGDGEAALAEVGWYGANSGGETHPVDERMEKHPFGLVGMHGNVLEWCLDGWDADAYKLRVDAGVEPLILLAAGDPLRVLRGGSWDFPAWDCRSAIRIRGRAVHRCWDVGFRVCLVPGPLQRGGEEPSQAQTATGAEGGGTTTQAKGAVGAEVDIATERMPRAAGRKFLEQKPCLYDLPPLPVLATRASRP